MEPAKLFRRVGPSAAIAALGLVITSCQASDFENANMADASAGDPVGEGGGGDSVGDGDGDGGGDVVDPPHPDNLLDNPRFDAGSQENGCPSEWTCVTYRPEDAGSFAIDDSVAYAGFYAARWSADEGAPATVIRQIHPSSPGATYEASVAVKSEGLAEPPYLQILFQSASGEILDTERFVAEGDEGEWTRLSGTTSAAPAGTANVRFNLSTEGSAGTVWWDDAQLVAGDPGDDDGGEPIAGIHLCDLGLSDGDLINPYLEEHVASGETVVVCRGSYRLRSISLAGDDWALIAPSGATLEISGSTLLATEGARYRVSGFIFDQTASGALMRFNPAGDDWIVDHVAWRGEHPGGARLMAPSVDSEGATGLIDRLYMGDGQAEGTKSGAIWVNANRGHFGELTFRRAYFAHFIDNALYATGVPTNGQPGKTHVEDSFFWSNTISNARTGSLSGPCFIRRSVFILDDTTQECGVGCSNPGARTTRAVWSWYGEVIVEDSDFTIEHGARLATSQGGTITERGNRTGAQASTEPPPGVPTSPEDIYAMLE